MKATINNLRSGERERMMRCPGCGSEYSADKTDYFRVVSSDTIIKCECGKQMDIVSKQTRYLSV